ncbi:MAG: hypothetical protein AB1444_01665 [Spirochaetota bacterium]
MLKRIILFFYVSIIPLMLACTSLQKDISNNSFIFGRIISDTESLSVQYVNFIECPNTKNSKEYESDTHKQSGYFWLANLKSGSYRAIWFYQKSLFDYITSNPGKYYILPSYGSGPFLVRINKPGIYYMGTYKYIIDPKKNSVSKILMGSPTTFDMEKVKDDNPAEILEWILKNRIRKSSPWYHLIEKTLKERSWINAEDTVKL